MAGERILVVEDNETNMKLVRDVLQAKGYSTLEATAGEDDFFVKWGTWTIVLSRFAPIIRTCAPFVAGIGRMPYARFQTYNVLGGLAWVLIFIWAGYFFGNIPVIKDNFGLVTIGIIVASMIPVAWVALKK